MRATGIVRRIDDLGRVVIPKEIRRTMRIREGDPLEIFTAKEGEIVLKRYSPIGELSEFAEKYTESVCQTLAHLICVCDMDQIVAASGSGKKEVINEYISQELVKEIENRKISVTSAREKKHIRILANQKTEYEYQVISPIICEGDAIGGFMILSKDKNDKLGNMEEKIAQCASVFLGKQMEQ